MEYSKSNDDYFIRIDRGESLFESLLDFASKENLDAGSFSGIGALQKSELGFYHLSKKEYHRKTFQDEAELISLNGNLALLDDTRILHIHCLLGGDDFSTYGGHLFSAEVAVTCEITFRAFHQPIYRKMNDSIGLNLTCFHCPK